jgi:adenylate cyclase
VEVQRHLIGGYVDKFIGDAVMAMWGAPTDNSDHADDTLIASMAISERIEQERTEATSRGEHGFGVKIGLHSGIAIVGNVGSEQRYNYTGVGQTVNVASRFENLSGLYHCSVVIGPTTAKAVADRITLRELDSVLVKGLDEPLTIYQPIARYGEETPEQARTAQQYRDALEHYRNRQFKTAYEMWEQLSATDGPSSVMASRAREYIEKPPSSDWDGIWVVSPK